MVQLKWHLNILLLKWKGYINRNLVIQGFILKRTIISLKTLFPFLCLLSKIPTSSLICLTIGVHHWTPGSEIYKIDRSKSFIEYAHFCSLFSFPLPSLLDSDLLFHQFDDQSLPLDTWQWTLQVWPIKILDRVSSSLALFPLS